MQFFSLLVLALSAEAVWETLKMTWQKGKLCIDKIGALSIGVILCLSTGLDIFELLGITVRWPIVGMILTGVLISRGSNFIHDFIKSIENIQIKTKN